MLLTIVGAVATVTSVIALPPQLYQTYKTKSAQDLSLFMLVNFFICSLSWVAYGVLTNTNSVIITNVLMTIFSLLMIWLKLYYEKYH